MHIQHILMAVLVAAIWGLNFVVVKVGLQEMPPLIYGAGRFLVAATPIFFYLRKPPPVSWQLIVSIGATLGVLKFAFLFLGIHLGMAAGLSSLVLQSQVFFTLILSVWLLHVRLRLHQITGMLIAFAGISVIAFEMYSQSSWIGFLMLLGAALSWAVANILYQKVGKVDMFSLTVWTSLVPPLPMIGLALLVDGQDVISQTYDAFTWAGVGCLLFTACIATWIGSTFWGILLRTYSAAQVAPYSLLVPVFGMTSSWLFLGEQFSSLMLWACSLVLGGLVINQWQGNLRILSFKKEEKFVTPAPVPYKILDKVA